MIKLPFTSLSFTTDIKKYISGVNVSFDFENIESFIIKAAAEIQKIIGTSIYNTILEYKDSQDEVKKEILESLKRALLHLGFYHGNIFIAVKIGNDGITTKKNNDETTAFKYQTDELKYSLVETAWFWLSLVIENLDKANIEAWNNSDIRKSIKNMIVSPDDMAYIAGINSTYFFWKISPIIRRIIDKEINNRISDNMLTPSESDSADIKKLKDSLKLRIKEAVIHKSIAISVKSLSQYEIPEPLRKNPDNELTKEVQNEESFRNRVSAFYDQLSGEDFTAIETIVKSINNLNNSLIRPLREEIKQSETDKFIFI